MQMSSAPLSPQSRASTHTHTHWACRNITYLEGPHADDLLLSRQILNLMDQYPDPAVCGHLGLLEQVEMREQLQPGLSDAAVESPTGAQQALGQSPYPGFPAGAGHQVGQVLREALVGITADGWPPGLSSVRNERGVVFACFCYQASWIPAWPPIT